MLHLGINKWAESAMKRGSIVFFFAFVFVVLAVSAAFFLNGQRVHASAVPQAGDDVSRGAALYDDWIAATGSAPQGNMPLWSNQSTNSRSGADTWRCVECHGWDYRGNQGAYATGTHQTGFPGVLDAAKTMNQAQLVQVLKGSQDSAHDFSAYLDDAHLQQLAVFLDTALIDTSKFIDPATHAVIGGDDAHGKQFYDSTCSTCHGPDGRKIVFRYEGADAYLGTLANTDPWRFLHKTRYGTPGTNMVVGHDIGWTEEDGRDVLAYAQHFPTGEESPVLTPVIGPEGPQQTENQGGPIQNFFTSLLTALGAMVTGIGFAILLLGVLAAAILLIISIINRRNE